MAFVDISRQGDTQVSYRFPLDLMSETQGHFMTITAFPSQSKMSNNTNKSPISIALFIPGGNNNGALTWQMEHQYDEVKLTRLGSAFIGAIPGVNILASGAQGAARIAGQGIINPKVDVLYANSDLREFQFGFLMAPKSLNESKSMENIIKYIRMYAAPVNQGPYFISPAEFQIEFYNKGQINTHIPKVSRCVLTDIQTDFTPQGEWSTFRNGYPVTCRLALSFQEMEIITRQAVEQGF